MVQVYALIDADGVAALRCRGSEDPSPDSLVVPHGLAWHAGTL
jgi:hypothetical protein